MASMTPERAHNVFVGRGPAGEAIRDEVNALAAELTAQGPGRFGQPETVRYLLAAHRAAPGRLAAAAAVEMERNPS